MLMTVAILCASSCHPSTFDPFFSQEIEEDRVRYASVCVCVGVVRKKSHLLLDPPIGSCPHEEKKKKKKERIGFWEWEWEGGRMENKLWIEEQRWEGVHTYFPPSIPPPPRTHVPSGAAFSKSLVCESYYECYIMYCCRWGEEEIVAFRSRGLINDLESASTRALSLFSVYWSSRCDNKDTGHTCTFALYLIIIIADHKQTYRLAIRS